MHVPDPRDIVDIDGLRPTQPGSRATSPHHQQPPQANAPANKPFLMIWFRCCSTYGRLPKSADGLSYSGRCPKCLAKLDVPVGEGGTNRRMFEAE
jgi:hypothetical protein